MPPRQIDEWWNAYGILKVIIYYLVLKCTYYILRTFAQLPL